MMTATEAQDAVLPKLSAFVRLAQNGTGARMTAYDAVGRRIGASGSWVRMFLGRQAVGLDGHVLLTIGAAYARLCSSIDAAADAPEASNALLGGNSMRIFRPIARLVCARLGARRRQAQLRAVQDGRPHPHWSVRFLRRVGRQRTTRL